MLPERLGELLNWQQTPLMRMALKESVLILYSPFLAAGIWHSGEEGVWKAQVREMEFKSRL